MESQPLPEEAGGVPFNRRPPLRNSRRDNGSARRLPTDSQAARLFCDRDHERIQAITRIVVSVLAALCLVTLALLTDETLRLASLGALAGGYGLLATLYYLVLSRHLGGGGRFDLNWVWRQPLVIAADIGIVSIGSLFLGAAGLALYPLLLWIIVGNGVCFGPRQLGLAAVLSAPLFALVHLLNGVATALPVTYVGLLAGLIVLPRVMQRTLTRMVETNLALRQQKEQAEHRALHDTLTDLPNRHLLLQRLGHAIHRLRRNGGQLAVLFLDLDGFKRVNDSQGHDAGDGLLVQIAACLRANVRDMDTLCRLGGDEFILLIEDCGSGADLEAIITRLFGCARRFYRVHENDSYVTWSCGVAIYPKDGGDGNTLLRNADIAMYQAKARGGDCAVHYDPAMSRQVLRDLTLRTELRRAIDQSEFMVMYQPQVDASTGATVAIEALVRWRHPERGLLAPDEFIGVALISGLMAEVDAQVLATALADVAVLRRAGCAELKLAVNLSARQLASADFEERLLRLFAEHDLDATVLTIESTEAALLEEADTLRDLIRQLRHRGLRFALDDFGTGYSSLAHLRRFDIDQIKIDHSFIRGLPADQDDGTMVDGILAIATRLGLGVAAEGVETAAQRDWLLARGCHLQQGFHYGGPMLLPDLRQLLGLPPTS